MNKATNREVRITMPAGDYQVVVTDGFARRNFASEPYGSRDYLTRSVAPWVNPRKGDGDSPQTRGLWFNRFAAMNRITTLWRIACAADREAERLGTLEALKRAEEAWKRFNADPEVRAHAATA